VHTIQQPRQVATHGIAQSLPRKQTLIARLYAALRILIRQSIEQ
jgi:hypothetical protein